MRLQTANQEFVKQIACRAGDCVIFSEATTHGTLAWTAPYQRRQCIFRYSPANVAYSGRPSHWRVCHLDSKSSQ